MILDTNLVKHLFPLLLLADSGLAAKNHHCPPLGPALPTPTQPGSSRDVKNAIEALTEVLKSVTDKLNSTAVSIGVTSIHEDKPLLDLHHTPANLDPCGVKVVDADSVYRIGSVSKVYTVLGALLLKGAKMNDPVTEYLPELRDLKTQQSENNAITTVDWDKISLQASASHMGGIGADLTTDMTSFRGNWTELGLPRVEYIMGCAGLPEYWILLTLANWDNYLSVLGPSPPISLASRLYPTASKAEDKTSWKAVYRFGAAEEVTEQEKAYFWENSICTTWVAMDRGAYEFLGLDEMQFKSEGVVEMELVAFRTSLKRVE